MKALLLIGLLGLVPAAAVAETAIPAQPAEPSPWQRRAEEESQWRKLDLPLIPHRFNYFLPLSYNTSPRGASNTDSEHVEAKFQLSIKVLMLNDMFDSRANLFFGYSQLSLWQVYNRRRSAPFRDTNHEPEVFVSWETNHRVWGAVVRRLDVGLSHQSNGVGAPDSRSWNRAFAQVFYDWDHFAFVVKPWIRLPDPDNGDDNPHIRRYLGNGEFTVAYFLRNHTVSVTLRNNLRLDHNRGALQLDYTYPLTRNLTGLAQYFTGYGESLLDYNRTSNRFSLGIALGHWG